MDLYSIDKLMHETRQLAAKYRQTTGSTLPVTGEIARYDVAKALNLRLIEDQTLGYDAIGLADRDGLRILIKGRVLFEDSKSTPRIDQPLNFKKYYKNSNLSIGILQNKKGRIAAPYLSR